MQFLAIKGLARALAIAVPLVACPVASAQEKSRGLVFLGAGVADFDDGARSPGIDLMLGYGPGGPWWLVAEAAIHFGSNSSYTLYGDNLDRGMFCLAAGPQLAYTGESLRIYGHVLATFTEVGYRDSGTGSDSLTTTARSTARVRGGGGRTARPAGVAGYAGGTPSLVSVSGPGFALGFGVDVFVGKHSAIRLFQFEYLPSLLRETDPYRPPGVPAPVDPPEVAAIADQISDDHEGWSHHFRVSLGYVHTWK